MHYLQCFPHPGPLLQSVLLQSSHLILQVHPCTLPPLEGALWDPLGQVLQDPEMVAQELEELLITEKARNVKD